MNKLKIWGITFCTIIFLVISNTTYAKYVIEKQLVAAKININRLNQDKPLKENAKVIDLSGNEALVELNTENNKNEKLELII